MYAVLDADQLNIISYHSEAYVFALSVSIKASFSWHKDFDIRWPDGIQKVAWHFNMSNVIPALASSALFKALPPCAMYCVKRPRTSSKVSAQKTRSPKDTYSNNDHHQDRNQNPYCILINAHKICMRLYIHMVAQAPTGSSPCWRTGRRPLPFPVPLPGAWPGVSPILAPEAGEK